MRRLHGLCVGAICVTLLCIVSVNRGTSEEGIDLLLQKIASKGGQPSTNSDADQKSELAYYLKKQLNEQVAHAESQLFDSTLKSEGIQESLKMEGFTPPSSQQLAIKESRVSPKPQKKQVVAHVDKHETTKKNHDAPAVPFKVRLAERILKGKPLDAVKRTITRAGAHHKSKLVLKAVLDAQSSPAGRRAARDDEALHKSVMEADAIKQLAKTSPSNHLSAAPHSHHASSPAAPPVPRDLLAAAAMMASLDGPSPTATVATTTSTATSPAERIRGMEQLDGSTGSVEQALRAQLDAVVARRQRQDLVHALRAARRQVVVAGAGSRSAAAASQARGHGGATARHAARRAARAGGVNSAQRHREGDSGAKVSAEGEMQIELAMRRQLDQSTEAMEKRVHPRRPRVAAAAAALAAPSAIEGKAAPPVAAAAAALKRGLSQLDMERELRNQLDTTTKGLEQRNLYRAELDHPARFRRAPSPAARRSFGGLDIRKSPEMALEGALREELNQVVKSQERQLFHRDARLLLS